MADKDEMEIEVDVQPGAPVEVDLDTGATAPVIDPKPETTAEDEGSKSLKEQMAAMQAARDASAAAQEQAEQRAREAAQRADKAEKQVHSSQYQVVLGAIDKVKAESDQAVAEYAKAMEEGRYTDAAKAQRIMARSESRLDQLESAKQNFSDQEPRPAEGAVRPEPQRQAPVDPVEALAAQLSPKSAAWVRQHPQCATDDVAFSEMVAADKRARREGISADSDEYFRYIEKRLGFDDPAPEPEPERRRAIPAAPVSREAPGAPTGPRRIRLTAEEQEVADMNGMTYKEYAEQKAAYQAEKAGAH